ncbi:hypothetical protein Poli38472_011119 [Pythium oligandrum]|uniref:ABC transporter domain-containing protein n=1 Tax=Pythium oligandrum TaxID=41045 RepID=A0A8K1FNN0_PYTOL|nr:hypothetical protein Poli38472_011119 [Pythium oligandrum]|eukprot:TMW67499.1 hypothetical protein Poli38472_011119 [Pythium oligandrum]
MRSFRNLPSPEAQSTTSQHAQAMSIDYSSGKALLAQGSEGLHDHYATHVEKAMGRGLPRMEVRFRNLSLSTQVAVDSEGKSHGIPTVASSFKQALQHFIPGKKHKATKHILKDISGVFKPGTMTLVLGQPGSGKSSLLKVLSGRFPLTSSVDFEGDISYNGVDSSDITRLLPQFASYVTQRDCHFPTMTVKETLAFAHECCGAELSDRELDQLSKGTREENKAAMDAASAISKHLPEVVIHQLGLEHCQDTVVGDAMLRGVSGGERKRVTIGEMEFGSRLVALMDEISTGLDSAATYDIVKTQRSATKKLGLTVVMALLQPSPEVFGLFDEVMLLNKGEVMYHGPREQVASYFESLGFVCPAGRDVADFLLDLGTSRQHQYQVARVNGGIHPFSASEFADEFVGSSIHGEMLAAVASPIDAVFVEDMEQLVRSTPEFHQTFMSSTWTLMKREVNILRRNEALIQGRSFMVVLVGLLYSSLFYQFDPSDVQVVMGTLYATTLFLSLGQSAQIPMFLAARDIFYKQRRANFYRTASYVLASSVSQVPVAFVEAIVFGALMYWMCGFVGSVASFLVFELLLFLTNLAYAAWFFFLSAISPNLHVAEPLGLVSLICFYLFAGFVITKDAIPDYFIWIFWINPISWCLRSLAINQYTSSEFDVCEHNGVKYCELYGKKMGSYLLGLYEIEADEAWLWYGVIFMVAAYIGFMAVSTVVLEWHRFESPEHISMSDESTSGSQEPPIDDYLSLVTPREGDTSHIEVEVTKEVQAHERHFTPVTLAFKDLWYSVPDPKDPKGEPLNLLKGISGFATPGTITALMGSSGAGKTTLMDVIAGRKTGGKIEGQIFLNGHVATDLAIRRATGYCEQMDIHSEASTFREALTFSAFLRQGSDVPDSYKYESVEECLDLLDMRSIADQIIRGSSVEQMKRLTIGVELAAQPSVLFLDEPTSGLDSRSAKVIMDGVRKVADTGRTVVCTIHQPSTDVFMLFDSLLLLKRGGQTVYFGDLGAKAVELVKYFESIDGVSPLDEGYNPATWMLEVIGAGVGNTANADTDFVSLFESSEKKALLDANLVRPGVCVPAPGTSALTFTSKRAASNWTQARFLLKRFADLYWRTPEYNATRLVMYLLLGLMFGLAFVGMDYESYQGINAGIGVVFTTSLFVGVFAVECVLPITAEDRAAFYRERAAQTYNAFWYFVAGSLIEIPYVFASALVFCSVFFPLAGFTGVLRFVQYWFHTSLHMLLQTYTGQCFMFALPSVEVAMILSIVLNTILFQVMGYNPPATSIPSGYKWVYEIDPIKFPTSILASLVFGECSSDGNELGCRQVANLPPTIALNTSIREYMANVFLIKRDEVWFNFAMMLVYITIFRILALLALRFINHQTR